MVITDRARARGRADLDVCRQVLRGGATAVQLRAKGDSDGALVSIARGMLPMVAQAGALFVVNDRPDIAAVVGAGACHLGPEDLDVEQARRLVGDAMFIGFSAGSVDEARQAEGRGADYIGAGPVFLTDTKHDAGAPLGLAGLAAIVAATPLPVIAVGGINVRRAAACVEAGACGVAVATAAVGAASIAPAVRLLRRCVDAAVVGWDG